MKISRRRILGYGTSVTLLTSSGCMGVLDSDGGTSPDSENSPTETAETVEQFRVVVEYSGTWRGDIRYTEDGNKLVRVPFAGLYDDPDRMEIVVPDDLEDSDDVGTIETPISFTTTDIGGQEGPSEESPFVVTLYVEGTEVDSETVTESGTNATVEY